MFEIGYYDPPDVREGNYPITCKGYMPETSLVVPAPELMLIIEQVEKGETERALKWLNALSAYPLAVDQECNFEGDVDAQFSGGKTSYTAYWTCPRCGTEGEEDREVGDDDPDL